MHLKDLLLKIRAAWKWTPERYPKLDTVNDPTAARGHVLMHVLKAVGTMATCQERYDHGERFGSEDHQDASIKLLVNALQMLALENLSEDEICAKIEKMLQASNA